MGKVVSLNGAKTSIRLRCMACGFIMRKQAYSRYFWCRCDKCSSEYVNVCINLRVISGTKED